MRKSNPHKRKAEARRQAAQSAAIASLPHASGVSMMRCFTGDIIQRSEFRAHDPKGTLLKGRVEKLPKYDPLARSLEFIPDPTGITTGKIKVHKLERIRLTNSRKRFAEPVMAPVTPAQYDNLAAQHQGRLYRVACEQMIPFETRKAMLEGKAIVLTDGVILK